MLRASPPHPVLLLVVTASGFPWAPVMVRAPGVPGDRDAAAWAYSDISSRCSCSGAGVSAGPSRPSWAWVPLRCWAFRPASVPFSPLPACGPRALSPSLSPAFMSPASLEFDLQPPPRPRILPLWLCFPPAPPHPLALGEPHLTSFLNKKSESDYDVEALLLEGEGGPGVVGGEWGGERRAEQQRGWGGVGWGCWVKGTHPLREDLSAIFLLLALYIF